MPRKKPAASNPVDDDLCLRCGRCCYAKVVIGRDTYYTDIPCQYLDLDTRLCTVYQRRFEVEPDCLSVTEGIKLRVFPADCPYVRNLKNYRPPLTCDTAEMSRLYLELD